ncbi:hypothetical protein LXL04_030290 [Taraxacum kok-saghyz]
MSWLFKYHLMYLSVFETKQKNMHICNFFFFFCIYAKFLKKKVVFSEKFFCDRACVCIPVCVLLGIASIEYSSAITTRNINCLILKTQIKPELRKGYFGPKIWHTVKAGVFWSENKVNQFHNMTHKSFLVSNCKKVAPLNIGIIDIAINTNEDNDDVSPKIGLSKLQSKSRVNT